MKRIFSRKSLGFLAAVVVMVFLFTLIVAEPSFAQSTSENIQEGVDSISDSNTVNTDLEDIIRIIVNTILFLMGVVAVIMIIIGGFRYTTSGGDASQTKAAKDTIMYAVVGIIVALLAFAIVNFVLDALGG